MTYSPSPFAAGSAHATEVDTAGAGVSTSANPADPIVPKAVVTATPPVDTFHEVLHSSGDGMLMYWPECNGFVALWPDEFRSLMKEADEHNKKIEALQEANRKLTETSVKVREAHMRGVKAEIAQAEAALEQAISDVNAASNAVKEKLEPLSKLDAKGGVKMVEMVPIKKFKDRKAKPIYIKSSGLKKMLAERRIYLVDGEQEKRAQEKLFKNGKFNTNEIKHRIAEKVQDQANFKKEWKLKPDDADAYAGVLSDWARTMNGDIAKFIERKKGELEKRFDIDPNDPHRKIDLSAEAQLMRYTAGAGLEVNFNPFKGNLFDRRDKNWLKNLKRGVKSGEFGIKGNAQATFAIAEGRVSAECYWPHYAGWHAIMWDGAGQSFELGFWRFYGDVVLSGGAGGSMLVELDLGVTYTGGKQGLRGIPPQNRNKPGVKVRAGGNGELDVFAGVQAGIDAKGALQWLNPEGEESSGKPLKVKDPIKSVPEFKDVAVVDTGVAGKAGLGIKGAFTIAHEGDRFVIRAKLGGCLGIGGDASLSFEVGTDTIGEFFKCVAYQLKRIDFHKMEDLMEKAVYDTYCRIYYLVITEGRRLEEFARGKIEDIAEKFKSVQDKIRGAIQSGSQEAVQWMNRIERSMEGWFIYLPPEVTGMVQAHLADVQNSVQMAALRPKAAQLTATIMASAQTTNHRITIAERMTYNLGEKLDAVQGEARIVALTTGTPYADCLQRADARLAKAQPLSGRPFIWNDEPAFVVATMGIDHAMFA